MVFITTLSGNAKLRKAPLISPFYAKSYFSQTTNFVKKIRENGGFVVSELVARFYEQDKCYENDSYDYRVMGLQ